MDHQIAPLYYVFSSDLLIVLILFTEVYFGTFEPYYTMWICCLVRDKIKFGLLNFFYTLCLQVSVYKDFQRILFSTSGFGICCICISYFIFFFKLSRVPTDDISLNNNNTGSFDVIDIILIFYRKFELIHCVVV